MNTFWNVYSPSRNWFAFGNSFTSKEEAERHLIKAKVKLAHVNKQRVANGYLPLVDDLSVVETSRAWTIEDISEAELNEVFGINLQ